MIQHTANAKMKRVALFVFLLFHFYSSGQQSGKGNLIANSINKSELNKKLHSIFISLKSNTPGVAVIITENGKVIARNSYGMASIEHRVPFTTRTVVRIPYSEGREFISAAAVLMEKDGILKLTDKVRTYFPKLPQWSEPVTILDLLNHRSGFVDEWATLLLTQNAMSNRFETPQFLRLLYTQPEPEIEPAKGYMYSNSDFGLLRLIMEKASGKSLPQWIKQRMFEPLQMGSTKMQEDPLEVVANRSDMYVLVAGKYRQGHVQKTSPGGNYFILTSANDLALWAKAVNDTTSDVGKAAAYLSSHVRLIPGKEGHLITGYTHRTINNQQVILHEGVNGFNYVSRITGKGLAVVVLGNVLDEGFATENKTIVNYLLQATTQVYQKLLTSPISVSKEVLKKYAGDYKWTNQSNWEGETEPRKFSSFFVEGDKLKMRYSGNYVVELIPVGKDVFYYKEGFGLQIRFSRSTAEAPMQAVATFDDGYPGATMVVDTTNNWNPQKEELNNFIGKYYSKHLDYYWYIEQDESGEMLLRRSILPDVAIAPDGLNQFHYIAEKYPGAGFDQWILFNKDDKGKVVGLTVWSARVMHHRFDKQ
jgi:CubicO group peptidase (beta-lactamase class C family)